MVEELDSKYSEIVDHLEALGLTHYPGFLRSGDGCTRVVWNDGDTWKLFIDLASRTGARVVYVHRAVVSARDELEEGEATSGDSVDSLAQHAGETFWIVLAYVAEGVVHRLDLEAQWWVGSSENPTAATRPEAKADIERLKQQAREHDWVRKIAYDRRYYGASRVAERNQAIVEVLVEFGVARDTSGSWGPLSQFAHYLRPEVAEYLDQVKSEVEDQALSEVTDLVAQLMAANPEWLSWRVSTREQKAKRLIVERYGLSMPAVAAEVARRQP